MVVKALNFQDSNAMQMHRIRIRGRMGESDWWVMKTREKEVDLTTRGIKEADF